ncbi:hypothetical protein PAXRUDRAFT_63649, partial [Paxillus rubicundulus Ve08.2h10]
DGSVIPLFQKPGFYGETFFDQKSNYSLNCQLNMSISSLLLCHPGSAHDAHAFQNMHIYEEHDTLLAQDEWIWEDSAFPLTTWLVPPFKKPWDGCQSKNQ